QRKCRLPCFEMLPSLSLPPVECRLGTKPIHAARLRPDENVFQSPTSATSAVATIGPTPGISSSRRLSSLERCQAWRNHPVTHRSRRVGGPSGGYQGANHARNSLLR